jgi:hypothetical protein
MAVSSAAPALSTFPAKVRVLPYRGGPIAYNILYPAYSIQRDFFGQGGKTSPRSRMVLGKGSVGPRADDNEHERAGIGPSGRNLASTRGFRLAAGAARFSLAIELARSRGRRPE